MTDAQLRRALDEAKAAKAQEEQRIKKLRASLGAREKKRMTALKIKFGFALIEELLKCKNDALRSELLAIVDRRITRPDDRREVAAFLADRGIAFQLQAEVSTGPSRGW